MIADDNTIDAVPTDYNGITFRSRLEAGWAASLDSLGVGWQYEPETVTLPSGTIYIPDFWLPDLGTWIEVKGPGVPRVEKAIELGETRACHCARACTCPWPGGELVLIGHPPLPYSAWADPNNEHLPYAAIRNMDRRHRGHLNWSAAHGPTAYFTQCPSCLAAGWSAIRFLSRCRACRQPLLGVPAYRPQDKARALEFMGVFRPSILTRAEPDREAGETG